MGAAVPPHPARPKGAFAAAWVDVDNDGLLDLVAMSASGTADHPAQRGPRLGRPVDERPAGFPPIRCDPRGGTSPPGTSTVTATPISSSRLGGSDPYHRNDGGNRHVALGRAHGPRQQSQRDWIEGGVARRQPARASRNVERHTRCRARRSRLRARRPPAADVVRVLWPAGILQAEIPRLQGPQAPSAPAATAARKLALTELDRKPSSCPYLYTWNGERVRVHHRFHGRRRDGLPARARCRQHARPEEYTRIAGERLRARDGRYELRVTNELEEALFVDRLELLAIDHPQTSRSIRAKGWSSRHSRRSSCTAARRRRRRASMDDDGRDVLDRVRDLDRRFSG